MSKKKEDNPKYYEKGHTELYSAKSPKIDKLKELYEKDRYKARIIFMNNTSGYEHYRIMLFKEENGDFAIVRFRRRYGISKTNKIYSHEKRLNTVTYTKKKFWIINNDYGKKYVTHLSLDMIQRIEHQHSSVIIKCLAKRFTWINHMMEENVLRSTSFNTIVSEKIYSLKKALKKQYKVPLPSAKIIHRNTKLSAHYTATNLKYYLDHVDSIEALKEVWFTDGNLRSIFHDSLKMAKTLDKKINCSWSDRRLKEEHDKWAQEISDVIFIDGDRKMNINEIFIKFSEHAGYHLLKTTREMAYEGKRLNHCVATYINKVETGGSAIYRIGQHTLEVVSGYSNKVKALKIGQLRGYNNASVPDYINNDILKCLVTFNKEILNVEASKDFYDNKNQQFVAPPFDWGDGIVMVDDDLPF